MSERSMLYTSGETARITGLTTRQLQYWDKTGFVKPTEITKEQKRLYSFQDLVALKAARKLLEANLSLQRVKLAINHLHKQIKVRFPESEVKDVLCHCVFVTDGERLFELIDNPLRLVDILSDQTTFLWAVGFKEVVGEVNTGVMDLRELQNRLQNAAVIGEEVAAI